MELQALNRETQVLQMDRIDAERVNRSNLHHRKTVLTVKENEKNRRDVGHENKFPEPT